MRTNAENIGQFYAKALIELAAKRGDLADDTILNQLYFLAGLNQREDEFREFLESELIKYEEKRLLIDRIFSDKIASTVLSFFKVLIDHDRTSYLPEIAQAFEDLYDEYSGETLIDLTFAAGPDASLLEDIAQQLSQSVNAPVKLNIKINPDILGGVIIEQQDLLIDNSFRSLLKRSMENVFQKGLGL